MIVWYIEPKSLYMVQKAKYVTLHLLFDVPGVIPFISFVREILEVFAAVKCHIALF